MERKKGHLYLVAYELKYGNEMYPELRLFQAPNAKCACKMAKVAAKEAMGRHAFHLTAVRMDKERKDEKR